ncbi:MAG: lycopene cyclase domain-containing protein [Chloroflexi bacterium]|nr:lycopene cyclase domain-containing protein [Chloroflexota bacterium]
MGNTAYLILTLAWGAPLIALQWLIGLDVLISHWRVWLLAIGVPTLYLIGVDAIALGAGIWAVDVRALSGILLPIVNVPLEHALHFGALCALAVQTLILWHERTRLWTRLRRFGRLLRGGWAALRAERDLSE